MKDFYAIFREDLSDEDPEAKILRNIKPFFDVDAAISSCNLVARNGSISEVFSVYKIASYGSDMVYHTRGTKET